MSDTPDTSDNSEEREPKKRESKLAGQPLAYRLSTAPDASGISRSELYIAIGAGELVARKHGNKTIILAEDLLAFLRSLPAVKPTKAA